jgi:4'-phosphopantetheinyl transferase
MSTDLPCGLPLRLNIAPLDPPAPGVADVWHINLQVQKLDELNLASLLSETERQHANAMTTSELRRIAVASRAILRIVLSQYLKVLPSDIVLRTTDHGKPVLCKSHGGRIGFNLSHAGNQVLLAVSNGTPVGIDIECNVPVSDWQDIVSMHFSAREEAHLLALDPTSASLRFIEFWTRKEAVLKALGVGLSGDLKVIELVDEDGNLFSFLNSPALPDQRQWSLRDLRAPRGYRACVALEGPRLSARRRSTTLLRELLTPFFRL